MMPHSGNVPTDAAKPARADRDVACRRISGSTSIYGVWGFPVRHSRSPAMHNAAFAEMGLDAVYAPFEVSPAAIRAAVAGIRALNIKGVNVTVPLKELVPPCLDWIDETASRLGVVNTVVNRNGSLQGYSTDGPGFIAALERLAWPVQRESVCILGAGGSARAVADALAARGNTIFVSNRTFERAELLAQNINRHFADSARPIPWGAACPGVTLVVNTTSLGMHPNHASAPEVHEAIWEVRPRVYDLVYAPQETVLMRKAKAYGCSVSNGLGMLVYQGALSLALWTGRSMHELPLETMRRAVEIGLVA